MTKRFDRAAAGLWVALTLGGLATVAVLSGSGDSAQPQSGQTPAPEFDHGWFAIVSSPGVKEKARFHSHAAEFGLQKDQTLVPGYPTAFSVTYSATVTLEKGGKYRFGVLAQGGKAKLSVSGTKGANRLGQADSTGAIASTDWVAGDGSPVSISVLFDRVGNGDTRLQTYWEKQGTPDQGGFYREPLPAHAARIPGYSAKEMALYDSASRGRTLLGEMKCVACHTPEDGAMTAVKAAQAPLLGEVGRRASPEWIQQWVMDPQKVKPGSYMPDVMGDTPKDKAEGEAITHFLVSLGGPVDWEPFAKESQVVEQGRRLYHSVGCIACHGAIEPAAKVFGEATLSTGMPSTSPPSPFGAIAGKWRPAAMSEYLQDPLRTHPSGRMPSMALSSEEADYITTYLLNAWGHSESAGESGFQIENAKVEAGRAAFSARGCANCHEIGHGRP
jgi:mono/diheme cytochrome c family protein